MGTSVFLGVASVAMCLASCGDGPENQTFTLFTVAPNCTDRDTKKFVSETMGDWYLYVDALPAIDYTKFAGAPDALLDELTLNARVANRDRFFSALTTVSEDNGFLVRGDFIGFGLTFARSLNGQGLFVVDVLEESPAARAGFMRGDRVLSIGKDSSDLVPVSAIIDSPKNLSAALGSNFPGVTRTFLVQTTLGSQQERIVSKSAFTYESVPHFRILENDGQAPIGYIQLRAFLESSGRSIKDALELFAQRDVRQIVVDLRYNGGGVLDVAQSFADLLSAGRVAGDVMFRTNYNEKHSANSRIAEFRPTSKSIAAERIAFITTGLTASASEVLINSLSPYVEVSIIGAQTLGKPVGNVAIDMPGCDVRLRLVAFSVVNGRGNGGYFDGLPDTSFSGAFCPTSEDLSKIPGNTDDPLMLEAVFWLNNRRCGGSTLMSPINSNDSQRVISIDDALGRVSASY